MSGMPIATELSPEIVVDADEAVDELIVEAPADEVVDEVQADDPPEELVATIEGEVVEDVPAEADDTPTFRKMRHLVQQFRKEKRALEAENRALKQRDVTAKPETVELGPEPDIEDADVDYDRDKLRAKWATWAAKKQEIDNAKVDKDKSEREQREAWDERVTKFTDGLRSMGVAKPAEVTEAIDEKLTSVQQGMLVAGLKDAAPKFFFALSKNPNVLDRLSKIKDPAEFLCTAKELQMKTTVTARSKPAAPAPESVVRGTAPGSRVVTARLAELQAKAQRTGDYTAYFAAKNQKAA